jgi:hypothetical protein
MPKTSLLLAVLTAAVLVAAPRASAQQPASGALCTDSLYQVLRARELSALPEREYQYFVERDRACVQAQAVRALADAPSLAPAAAPPRGPRTETRTQERPMGYGADVFVTNRSQETILVNTLRVFECENVRRRSCGLHHPRARILPGQERRVLTIRVVSSELRSRYRYEYDVTTAEP